MILNSEPVKDLAADMRKPLEASALLKLWWLGQAGFAIRSREHFLLIDPYLSDSLAEKYRGKEFPHARMMPVPLLPSEIRGLTAVFCTHGHSDHLDPGTLPALAEANPECQFVVPAAAKGLARERGLINALLRTLDDNEQLELGGSLRVAAVASAHETVERDADGFHKFLGYVITLNGISIYHGGDGIPYPELQGKLAGFNIALALLPANGRDEFRRSRNVPGNFTLTEAAELCREVKIPFLIAHHFGMFDFNTVDPETLQREININGWSEHCFPAQTNCCFILKS